MPVQQYREYQKKRVETARAARNEANLKEVRHNAFLENAKKHGRITFLGSQSRCY